MKKFLALAIVLTICAMNVSPALAVPPPTDKSMYVSENGETEAFLDCDNIAVLEAKVLGIVKGCGGGYFRPNETLNRAEFAQMLYNAFSGEQPPEKINLVKEDGTVVEGAWWIPAEFYLFGAAVQPWYGKVDDELYSKICLAYYGGDKSYDFAPGGSASYDWVITMSYLIWAANGDLELDADFESTALAWATEREVGPNGFWRHVSSGRFFTRAEACELIFQLWELS